MASGSPGRLDSGDSTHLTIEQLSWPAASSTKPIFIRRSGQKVETNHAGIVRDVQAATAANDVVVVGMAQNPHPNRARKALDAAGIPYKYLEYGSYLDGWRRRNAQMGTGWPTFPMVFVKGVLIGGADDVERLI